MLDSGPLYVPSAQEWAPKYQYCFLRLGAVLVHALVKSFGSVLGLWIHSAIELHSDKAASMRLYALSTFAWQSCDSPIPAGYSAKDDLDLEFVNRLRLFSHRAQRVPRLG
ncbi:hypothetical protein D3C80_1433380 [compost metagenome]